MLSFVKTEILEDRLDAEFYTEDQIENLNKLKKFGILPLTDYCLGINVGYTGELTSVYSESGVPLYRVSDIDQIFLNDSNINYVPENFANEISNIWIKDHDIVLAAVGNTIGKVAIKSPLLPDGVCSRALMIARPIVKKINPYFLISYLSCRFAQKSLLRGVSGSAQPVLNTPLIANLPVIQINGMVQKYIGDKVRQAEQLKTQTEIAKKIPIFIDAILRNILPENISVLFEKMKNDKVAALNILKATLNMSNGDEKFSILAQENSMGSVDTERENFHINRVSINAIEDFLSAQTYRPAVTEAYKRVLDNSSSLSSLCSEPIRQGATPHFSETGFKCIKSRQTRELFIEDEGYEKVNPLHEKNQRIEKLKFGDVIVTRQGAGTVGRASLFLDEEECYITDSLFLVRVDPNKSDSAFIAAYLRSYTGQRLLEKGVYGSTGQLNLSSKSLRGLPVFNFDRDLQSFLGDQIRFGYKLDTYQNKLIKLSKFLTEALIDGLIEENELIQAQNALEQGDNSLDRAILSQMTEDGYAVAGSKPLFADLDEFYELLEQAKELE